MPDVLERLAAARPEIANRGLDLLTDAERADLMAEIVNSSESARPVVIGASALTEIRRRPPRIGVRVLTVVGCVVLLAVVLGLGAFHLGKGAPLTPATQARTTVPATEVAVPDVVGQMLPPALAVLGRAGFRYRFSSVTSNRLNGMVVSENPAPGTQVSRATTIVLAVAGGSVDSPTGTVIVPNVVGETVDRASALLAALGLRASTPVPTGGTSPPGTVTSETPDAGSRMASGGTVMLEATSY
jgi:eukaryotic-like serine/threonine-protein kinase